MLTKGCQVFSFDPSMHQPTHKRHPNHLFEPIGVGTNDGAHTGASTLYGQKNEYDVLSLQGMMKRYNHTFVDVVRMDVEGAEWEVLQQWTRDKLWPKLGQLLMEIHMKEHWVQNHSACVIGERPRRGFQQACE